MPRKKRSRTPGALIANSLQEIQTVVRKITHGSAVVASNDISPGCDNAVAPNCDGGGESGGVATAQCCQEILQRVIVELALLSLLYNNNDDIKPPTSAYDEDSNNSTHQEGVAARAAMPPPPVTSSAGEAGAGGGQPALLRFMNPVQDLGRSFIGFLLGGSSAGPAAATAAAAAPAEFSAGRKSAAGPRKRDSVISTSSVGGRSRPPGHPALPSSHSTPIPIRRTRPDLPPSAQHSLGRQHSSIAKILGNGIPPLVSCTISSCFLWNISKRMGI
jgi:hypothetical protein